MKELKHSKNIMRKTLMNLYHDIEYNVMENNTVFDEEVSRNVVYTRLTVRYPFMKCGFTHNCITHMTSVFASYLNDKLTVNQYYKEMKKILNLLTDQFNHENALYLD